jgi:hypothetical protein
MSKYNTYFLKFADEDTAKTVLEEAQIYVPATDEEAEYYRTADHGWGFDPIGTIYNDDGVYNEETGEVISPPTAVDGWHANYIAVSLPESLTNYNLDPAPSTPYRRFL